MLGNRVIEFDKYSDGLVGYTIAVDTTAIMLNKPAFIQADMAGYSSDPISEPTDLQTVQTYINDTDAPDLAWSFASDLLFIFFKTDIYPYSSDTRFAIYGYRNNQPINTLEDEIDIKDKDIGYFIALAIREAALVQGKMVPIEIDKEILKYESIINAGG